MPAWWFLVLGCHGDDPVDGIGADDTGDTAQAPAIEIPLAGCYYYRTADVAIGEQHFQVVIDSGSTTLAVSADPCPSCVENGVEELYDTTHGTDMEQSASGRYSSGELGWSGRVFFDTVSMGGIAPVGMSFVAVSDQDLMFGTHTCNGNTLPVDGILGLRQDAALVSGTDSYLTQVVRSAGVDDSFAIRTCPVGGTLWLGGYDESHTTDAMSWVSFASSTSYSVYVTGFAVVAQDGTTTEAPLESTEPALLDSGGPHLLIPPFAYEPLIRAIASDPASLALGGLGWWGGTTPTTSSLPPDEIDATLPRLLVHVGVDAPIELTLTATQSYLEWGQLEADRWWYAPNVSPYDDFVDLGNLPMYAYVVYTDRVREQIGFAPAVPCD